MTLDMDLDEDDKFIPDFSKKKCCHLAYLVDSKNFNYLETKCTGLGFKHPRSTDFVRSQVNNI